VIVDKGNPTAGTEGSIVNHVGCKVRDMKDTLDKMTAQTLESSGVKLDTPYRKIPQMGFAVAFLTDPWGTRIELTERSEPPPSAQRQKPAQQ
jgi:predicted enzyme related to lactoylglutathione lyase